MDALAAVMTGHWAADVVAWAVFGLAVLLVIGWYLSVSAARLDRLHHRVESSFAALTTQLVRRGAAAVEAAPLLDPAGGLVLVDAASRAMGPWPDDGPWAEEHSQQQNDLTRALHAVFAEPDDVARLRADQLAGDTLAALGQACARVQIARRFHNDAVSAAQRRRRKRVVRWARLAGHAPAPAMVDFDDSVPAGLEHPDTWLRRDVN